MNNRSMPSVKSFSMSDETETIPLIVLLVSFGEFDISPLTIAVLIALSVVIFGAVGLSSLYLIQSDQHQLFHI